MGDDNKERGTRYLVGKTVAALVVASAIVFFVRTVFIPSAEPVYDHLGGFKALRIAHAGGGLNEQTYTNSYQALDLNLQKGFQYFEIDFSFTKDGHLVCLHDWKNNFTNTFGYEIADALTLEEFKVVSRGHKSFTNCTLDGLRVWMVNNSYAYIVTDVKGDNILALKMIHEAIPDADRRVIPQIYSPKDFETVKAIGFEQIIWTLYRMKWEVDEVLSSVDGFRGAVAVTMPKGKAKLDLSEALALRGVPSYVHTVNSTEEFELVSSSFKTTEIYTDFLLP